MARPREICDHSHKVDRSKSSRLKEKLMKIAEGVEDHDCNQKLASNDHFADGHSNHEQGHLRPNFTVSSSLHKLFKFIILCATVLIA